MISICITTSDMGGRNVEFLMNLINSISRLDYNHNDVEIIISDDSTTDDIKEMCSISPSLLYFRNPNPGKSSINMNHAISKATGDIIKPMFCDDYFIYPDTLSKFVTTLQHKQWAFCRSEHKESGRITHEPYHNFDLFGHDQGLAEGCNTYGCPSAVAFRKTSITFDENLIWLMDCEFYVRMQLNYGLPEFVNTAVNIREWEGQQSKTACTGAVIINERNYVIEKYKV
jgi:glycosyltransferase involved in cell wall biosynthesis